LTIGADPRCVREHHGVLGMAFESAAGASLLPRCPSAWDMDCGLVSITPHAARQRCTVAVPTLAELKHVHMVPHAAARGARTRCPRWRS